MTVFKSPIKLGARYKDSRSGIEGYATVLCFNTHGCVQVALEFEKDGKLESILVNEPRLQNVDAESLGNFSYETDLVLDRPYVDVQTGIKGGLAVVEFHEEQATRGIVRMLATDTKGLPAIKYHSIDDFLLKDVETEKVAERKGDKPSPVTHEVERR